MCRRNVQKKSVSPAKHAMERNHAPTLKFMTLKAFAMSVNACGHGTSKENWMALVICMKLSRIFSLPIIFR